jgi:hypothetical protein
VGQPGIDVHPFVERKEAHRPVNGVRGRNLRVGQARLAGVLPRASHASSGRGVIDGSNLLLQAT